MTAKHCWQSPDRPCTEACMAYRVEKELSVANVAPLDAEVHAEGRFAKVYTTKTGHATCALFQASMPDAAVVSLIPGAFYGA